MQPASLHLELVGGPHDGAEIVVPDVCACCQGEVAPGSVFRSENGAKYVVSSDRCYAWFLPLVADAVKERRDG